MQGSMDDDSPEQYFDCQPVRYCAIASPQGSVDGEVFLDFKKAQNKWKQVKGSRMKIFDDFKLAVLFANTPVKDVSQNTLYPPSPKADLESTPFSSAPISLLLKFRRLIEAGDVNRIRSSIEDNPMILVTFSDTPTLMQVRLRFNALHVAASAGSLEVIRLILSTLDSLSFWNRIYPYADRESSNWRRQHVTDLYLNSPELGNLETPIHFASKYGYVDCVRLLATHPRTQLSLVNRAGQSAVEIAASRISDLKRNKMRNENPGMKPVDVVDQIRRALNEHFVILADVFQSDNDGRVCLLPPVTLHQLQTILAKLLRSPPSGLATLLPFLDVAIECALEQLNNHSLIPDIDLTPFGSHGLLRNIRAFAGPMLLSEAQSFVSIWRKSTSLSFAKEFASIRLTDSEKGYERQGRYLSRLFGIQWFEFWDFLGDFADLSSESGLTVLEKHLKEGNLKISPPSNSEFSLSVAIEQNSNAMSHPLFFGEEAYASTPIVQRKPRPPQSPDPKEKLDPWNEYRATSEITGVLNDSLDESSSDSLDSKILNINHLSDSNSTASPMRSSLLSPLVTLLGRLTFQSPLRWLLIDGPVAAEPLFDPESSVPEYKRPVKLRTSLCLDRSPGKRRHSAFQAAVASRAVTEEPLTKKHSTPKPEPCLPPLFRHIFRALPGGDLELDTAVTLLCNNQILTDLLPPKRDRQSLPLCHHVTSLVKFPAVSRWKRYIDTIFDNFS